MSRPVEEKRQHPRFNLAVWVDCPDLSPSPFPAEAISVGGFRASLPDKPAEGRSYEVTLRVGDMAFAPCSALLAWSQEASPEPRQWAFGMLMIMRDEERNVLASILEEVPEGIQA